MTDFHDYLYRRILAKADLYPESFVEVVRTRLELLQKGVSRLTRIYTYKFDESKWMSYPYDIDKTTRLNGLCVSIP